MIIDTKDCINIFLWLVLTADHCASICNDMNNEAGFVRSNIYIYNSCHDTCYENRAIMSGFEPKIRTWSKFCTKNLRHTNQSLFRAYWNGVYPRLSATSNRDGSCWMIMVQTSSCGSGYQQASCNGVRPPSSRTRTGKWMPADNKNCTMSVNPRRQAMFNKPSPKRLKQFNDSRPCVL